MRIRSMQTVSKSNCFAVILVAASLGAGGRADAVDVLATAVIGQPYGVATIEIPVTNPVVGRDYAPVQAANPEGRLLYPVAEDVRVKVRPPAGPLQTEGEPPTRPRQIGGGRLLNRVGNLVRELADGQQDSEQTVARRVSFLFVGSKPLQVRLADASGPIGTYELIPQSDALTHGQLLQNWWTGYTQASRRQIDAADYPPWVENYLVAMLSGRLGLPLPTWYTNTEEGEDELLNTLALIAGGEDVSQTIFRDVAVGSSHNLPATLPLPAPPQWAAPVAHDGLASVPVEPLATRVPPECFYIRYGSFENYLWFRDLSDEYGGDITSMITLRGVQSDVAARSEAQLNLKTTQLSRMLGPSVIDDQAIIGRDLFLNDGATIGVVFKAKNTFLLRTSMSGDRTNLANSDKSVTLRDVKIAGKPVSLLSSSDNRVRSFMAVDGEYICVANSRELVRRFLEVGQSGRSLAETSTFRLARQLMPLERNDTIFAYFSPSMLQGLVSPQYLIELRRRLQAKSDVALVRLARHAADQELGPQETLRGIDELIATGFLPQEFGIRPDGSGAISVGDQVLDTMRGVRGSFLPIGDVKIDRVTSEESQWYSRIADQYSSRFPSMDPIMVGIQREMLSQDDSTERVTIHAEIAPWDPSKYGRLSQQLGPPTRVAMRFAPDDIIAAQAHVASPTLGPPTHLFAAVKDSIPPDPDDFDGLLNIYRSLRSITGYLGAWPLPGTLDRLPLGLGIGQPVAPGMNRLIGGLYRYNDGQFSILSFQPEVIQATLPFLAADEVNESAQIRFRAGNLNGSQIASWINAQLYDRARESSVAGANFLSMLTRQLRIDPDQVLVAAENILGSKLQCTLGGQYVFSPASGRWISTAWNGEVAPADAPAGYVAPSMAWFRGTSATLTQLTDRLVADAVLDVARN